MAATWGAGDGGSLPPMQGDPCSLAMSSTWFTRSGRQRRSFRGKVGLTRSASASQLQSLPPIMAAKQPLSFEDLYSLARVRAAKKAAGERKGGTSPHLLRTSGSLPDFLAGFEPGGRRRSKRTGAGYLDAPDSPEVALWALKALSSIPGETRAPGAPDREQSPREERHEGLAPGVPAGLLSPPQRRFSKTRAGSKSSLCEPEGGTGGEVAEEANDDDTDPALVELLDSLANKSDGFSEKEVARMRGAFGRFKVPGEADLHTDDLTGLLSYIGHVMTKPDDVAPILREITNFDYMDFDEFLSFMEKYTVYEREQFHKVFNEYDDDNSGEISLQELRGLVKALGFVPMRQMIQEALEVVDQDRNGQLNFDELVTFLAVYSHAEGFTRTEVQELRRNFDHFSINGGQHYGYQMVLPPESLSDALVQVFGLQVSDFTQKMGEQLSSGQGLQKSCFDKGGGDPECLAFNEFLIFARKIREEELSKCRHEHPEWGGACATKEVKEEAQGQKEHFDAADADQSGGISEQELRKVLIGKNYTPLRQVLNEIFAEVGDELWTPESELDFEEFFDFMLVFERRDGFLKAEIEALRKTFEKFDEDGSGEVNALECAALFRHLGYAVTLDDLRDYIVVADANGSGQLDFREFMRLMRLFREQELDKIKTVFGDFEEEEGCGQIPRLQLGAVLVALGHDPPEDEPARRTSLVDRLPSEGRRTSLLDKLRKPEEDFMTFDDIVTHVDSCREAFVKKERKKAGFTDVELQSFQELFDNFDKDKSGEIDATELQQILKEFGWEPKSREEQSALMGKLDVARAEARDAGIRETGPDGSPCIRFWTFVQLVRMLRTQREKEEEEYMAALQKDLKFSEGEVEDFRQVFRMWVRRMREEMEDIDTCDQKVVQGMPGRPETLSRDSLRRLVRSLGVSVTQQLAERLDVQLKQLDEQGRKETAELPFGGFLRIMRWLLDTDFAGINQAVAKVVTSAAAS